MTMNIDGARIPTGDGPYGTGPETTPEPDAFRFGLREHLINMAFWTLFAAVTAVNLLSNDYEPTGVRRAVPETAYWFLHFYVWAAATPVIFWLVWRYGGLGAFRLRNAAVLVGAGLVLTGMVGMIQGVLWGWLMGPPPGHLIDRGQGLLAGWLRNDDEAVTCAGVFLAGFLRQQYLRIGARERQTIRLRTRAAQLQAQLAQARLAALRSQLDPHFIFNSLNALSALMEEDPPAAQRMLARLSDLLRRALDVRAEEEVPLHQELELTARYLEILEIRFQGRLRTRIDVEPGVADARVPNLILQPLVENAMKHGVARAGGRGRIEVTARRSGDALELTVRDSGGGTDGSVPPSDGATSGGGLGLRNTRARLRELYGVDQLLRVRPEADGGTTARVRIPFRLAAPEPDPGGGAAVQEAARA